MITEKVENIFSFIHFLHSNIDLFLSKNPLIDKCLELNESRRTLDPDLNYKQKIEYLKVQGELEKIFDIVQKETTNVIKGKIQEFDIADISTSFIRFNAKADLYELRNNFTEKDLAAIHKAKIEYVEFRTKTNFHYFLPMFFEDMDKELASFFKYFNDADDIDFEPFQRKRVTVNSIAEAVKHLKGYKEQEHLPLQSETKANQESPKTLSNLITHQKSVEIVESIKIQYKNIKGKRLKLLLMAFQELELLPQERIAQKFYDCCKNEFNWNIASYNAMNGYNFNGVTDSIELAKIKQYIETIINTV